ncbi:hypothetical protein [Stenotrophomonas maltophilia]|uniref:hypothetical protein n=1 Tax=Stenotrophomonas maltophilia TaxID=40324 RepID=UPI0007EF5EDF|nr:hypothetical protein [Stenotrophomonas maltophilia]OBU50135.1 hypothetical protein A9K76_07940 [Stenotrophomonas maltophilia]
MSGKRLSSGRAAALRQILALMPNGATAAELKVAGNLEASHKVISCTLVGMRRTKQVTVEMNGVRGIWKLTPEMQRQYSQPPQAPAPARRQLSPIAHRPSDAVVSPVQKEIERLQLADEIAAFVAAGGVIEVLGNTPSRPLLNRRQVIQGRPRSTD